MSIDQEGGLGGGQNTLFLFAIFKMHEDERICDRSLQPIDANLKSRKTATVEINVVPVPQLEILGVFNPVRRAVDQSAREARADRDGQQADRGLLPQHVDLAVLPLRNLQIGGPNFVRVRARGDREQSEYDRGCPKQQCKVGAAHQGRSARLMV